MTTVVSEDVAKFVYAFFQAVLCIMVLHLFWPAVHRAFPTITATTITWFQAFALVFLCRLLRAQLP
jgi:hypothetical protein